MTEPAVAPERIIVGVDYSDNAARAALWAARQAVDLNLPLHLVHALNLPSGAGALIEPPEYASSQRRRATKLLDDLADRLSEQFESLSIVPELSDLGAAETLVALGDAASVLVTGARGHGGFSGMLLGTVSLKVAGHVRCPAVIVPAAQYDGPAGGIVLGAAPSEPATPICFAFQTAARLGEPLHIVRAWPPSPRAEDFQGLDSRLTARAEADDLAELIKDARARFPEVQVTTAVTLQHPVQALIDAAHTARLLVVGAHRRRGPLSTGLGDVVGKLICHATAPVAVVPIAA